MSRHHGYSAGRDVADDGRRQSGRPRRRVEGETRLLSHAPGESRLEPDVQRNRKLDGNDGALVFK